MMGTHVVPRWRLPLLLLFVGCALTGCTVRSTQSGASTLNLPSVRMALVKIPLNGQDAGKDVLQESSPIERFTPEPVSVAYQPNF